MSIRCDVVLSSRRRAASYVFVLGAALILTVIGMSTLTVSRIQMQSSRNADNVREAEILANSALERALLLMDSATVDRNPTWRGSISNRAETGSIALGGGTASFMLIDEADDNLSNDNADPVRVYGIGRVGDAVQVYSMLTAPRAEPLEVLNSAVHADGSLVVSGALGTVTVDGGPVSSNSSVTIAAGATLAGDAEAPIITNNGSITGSVSPGTASKTMPSASAFDLWAARATPINFFNIDWGGGKFEEVILSAGTNPYGTNTTNPEGIYSINVPYKGYELRVQNCRIKGTLVVTLEEKCTVRIKAGVIWEPHAPGYPLLIVKTLDVTNTDIEIDANGILSEASAGTNFNPPGLPFEGNSDSDFVDEYDPVLKGLIHVIRHPGDLTVTSVVNPNRKDITLIAEGNVTLSVDANITADPDVLRYPPAGYRATGPLEAVLGTYRRDELPRP